MQENKLSVKSMTFTALMMAMTFILASTSLGTIPLYFTQVTIAHVPIIITAIVYGFKESLLVALFFGMTSLIRAITAPVSVIDPFFINPLISVLPRLLIAVTSYYSYKFFRKIFKNFSKGETFATATSVVIGNLTNTFSVYTMLYLIYEKQITLKAGKSALSLIIAAISTTTLLKCIFVVFITVPIIFALSKLKRLSLAKS